MLRTIARAFFLLSAVLVASAASANPDGDESVIIGTLDYRGLTTFPKDAKVVVQLVDLSGPVTSKSVISEMTMLHPKPTAVPFHLPYDARAIRPNQRYGVRARVMVGKDVYFETVDPRPVLTQGNGQSANLMLEPARSVATR
jgi:putative lipoprotein